MKSLLIICDGMADRLTNKTTPLEAAETPNMDKLAKDGICGIMDTIAAGIRPGSDTAHLALLGYDPYEVYTGRGPLEAEGAGIKLEKGDVALRCNFATLASDNSIIDRRAGRNLTAEEGTELAQAINEQIQLESYPATLQLKNTVGYSGALVIKGKETALSGNIGNTDPAYKRIDGVGVADLEAEMVLKKSAPLDETEEAKISATLVNEFTQKSITVLDQHEVNRKRVEEGKLKANVIIARDAGHQIPKFPSLSQLHGLSFVCLADMNVERGISKLAGMSLVSLPLPSKDLEKDCKLRVKKLLEVLHSYDCFYIHIKGPDEPGHDGNFNLKSQLIATVDKHFVGNMLQQINLDDHLICITSDHSTPCNLKSHSDDPVPLLISGNKLQSDPVQSFSENECKKGELGILLNGTELMPMLVKILKE